VGDAKIVDGKLDVNATISGSAANATGWAYARGYAGPTIRTKTLISWVSLDNINVRSGSALTIDSLNSDNFDAIIYAELVPNRWMAGSSNLGRTQNVVQVNETQQNKIIQMAISYKDLGSNNTEITICRDGVQIGKYTDNPMTQWVAGNVEVIFGKRHTFTGTSGPGASTPKSRRRASTARR
jgi:hypothetical protein